MNHLKRMLILFFAVLFLCLSAVSVQASDAGTVSAETAVGQSDAPLNSGALFDEYIWSLFCDVPEASPYKRQARDQLGPEGQYLYDFLKEKITAVASGDPSTEVTITAAQLNSWGIPSTYSRNPAHSGSLAANTALNQFQNDAELENVVSALLNDCPYELYWYDKETGVKVLGNFTLGDNSISMTTVTFRFTVVQDMQAGNPYVYDPVHVHSAAAAAENAKAIVKAWEKASDAGKLHGYKDEICALVTYDMDAVLMGDFSLDADPWQLVYVFDRDPSTNVVCEGYAKAFQYLCDLSDLGANIDCITVSGSVPSGPHMWNILRIDGKNYLADVTNSDAGSIGYDGSLFLTGASGSVLEGYRVKGQLYTYNDVTMNLWGTGSDSYLNLSSTGPKTCPWSHDLGEWTVTAEPTCSIQGSKIRSCRRIGCNYAETQIIPTGEHLYSSNSDKQCILCGASQERLPVYRLYNPYTHGHLLTSAMAEKDALVRTGWHLDGVAWDAPFEGTPVYRLYNPYDDWHTYTTSESERDTMVAAGWRLDGIVSCGYTGKDGKPIYRLFNPYVRTNFHLFTASPVERDLLVNAGWRLDGIAWFAAN